MTPTSDPSLPGETDEPYFGYAMTEAERNLKEALEIAQREIADLTLQKAGLESLLVEAQEEIADLRAQTWKSIETAPMDGTHVILWYGPPTAGGYLIGAWLQPPGYCAHWCDGRPKLGLDPTHWMPLPTPPNT
jgi:hypothetical protein